MLKIVLVGYMGSGKSTIGTSLAKELNLPFFDLDRLIEQETGHSISEIFALKGEIWFRKKEHEVLTNFLNTHNKFVLSFGGGTPCYANNHKILQHPDIFSVYLKAQISTLIERLKNDASVRPLLQNNIDNLEHYIGQHLFERTYFYHFSKLKVNTDNLTIKNINQTIIDFIIKKTKD